MFKTVVTTTIRPRFTSHSTVIIQPRHDRSMTTLRPVCCAVAQTNKQIGVTAASGLRHGDLNDLW